MNAYKEMLKGIKWTLENCSSYEVSKEYGIPNRTVNRYQNGTSDINKMSLVTAQQLYDYYIKKQKEAAEMEKLKQLYAEWRKASEEMLADGFGGSVDCGEQAVREDFSNYTELNRVITFEEMLEIEQEFESNAK